VILSHIAPCEADRSPGVGMFLSTRRALPSDAWVSEPPEVWKVLLVAGACLWRCLLRLPRRRTGQSIQRARPAPGAVPTKYGRATGPLPSVRLCTRGRRETADSCQ
jgi:hypothetical protein